MSFCLPHSGGSLKKTENKSLLYCKTKEFSREVEMSKVESFYSNKVSNKSFSFELEQFFDLCFAIAVQGGCTDNIQYIPLLCCKTKGIFQES